MAVKYQVESETHYDVMDTIGHMSGSKADAEWIVSWLEKVLGDSAENLGLKVVQV